MTRGDKKTRAAKRLSRNAAATTLRWRLGLLDPDADDATRI
jgi:hypothetical protein